MSNPFPTIKIHNMNSHDFNKMMSLISKLRMAVDHAKKTDCTFNKCHSQSISFITELDGHMRKIEEGLTTARVLKPSLDTDDSVEGPTTYL